MSSTISNPQSHLQHADVIIVGAGLGGLATAARLARSGLRVTVCERASVAGGRGRTLERDGFSLNLGPHALYAAGPAMAMLRSLGIEPRGRAPDTRGVILRHDRAHTLPATPLTMLSTTALELRSKFELLRLFTRLPRMSSAGLDGLSCAEWLERQFVDEDLRAFVSALLRLSTYCGEPGTLSADAGLAQLKLALRGVLYLDGGWQQLVDALVERCRAAGVELVLGARVEAIGRSDRARWAVEIAGRSLSCDQLIVAGSPAVADALLGPILGGPRFAAATSPITAASLDLCLRGDWPGPVFMLDLDEPIYLSVPSRTAALAGPGRTLVSLVWYRRRADASTPASEIRARLEARVRRFMPEFEAALVTEQFLPDMVVAHDRPRPATGGLGGRTPAIVDEGLHLVGDWVGDRGQLLDASLASAATVCDTVLADDIRRSMGKSLHGRSRGPKLPRAKVTIPSAERG